MGRMRAIFSCLLAALLAASLAAQESAPTKAPPPKAGDTQPKTARKAAPKIPEPDPEELRLLEESYRAGAGLGAESRTALLIEQCNAAEGIEKIGSDWCHELFQLAKEQISAGDLRQHAQSRAAMSTSLTDPDGGLAMLRDVDITNTENDERSQAARVVFESVLRKRGMKALPDILSAAAALGDSGAYPYFATTLLLYGGASARYYQEPSHLTYKEAQVDNCNQALQQALTYFKKQSLNLSADFQFMTMLRAGAYSNCPASYLVHQAATDFSDELVKAETAARNGDSKIRVQAAKTLYDSASRMLQSIDPVLAESVDKKVGAVRDLKSSDAPPAAPPKNTADWKSDPDATAFTQKVDAAATVINNVPDGTTPHTPEIGDAIREGIDAGQKLCNRVHELDPDEATMECRGGGILASLMDAALRVWPEATIAQIENLPDGELKGYLLLNAARHVSEKSQRLNILYGVRD